MTEYDKLYDSYAGYRLVSRHNDIYLEREDGGESRRITQSLEIHEGACYFLLEGEYIVYKENKNKYDYASDRYFITPKSEKFKKRDEISLQEFVELYKNDRPSRK